MIQHDGVVVVKRPPSQCCFADGSEACGAIATYFAMTAAQAQTSLDELDVALVIQRGAALWNKWHAQTDSEHSHCEAYELVKKGAPLYPSLERYKLEYDIMQGSMCASKNGTHADMISLDIALGKMKSCESAVFIHRRLCIGLACDALGQWWLLDSHAQLPLRNGATGSRGVYVRFDTLRTMLAYINRHYTDPCTGIQLEEQAEDDDAEEPWTVALEHNYALTVFRLRGGGPQGSAVHLFPNDNVADGAAGLDSVDALGTDDGGAAPKCTYSSLPDGWICSILGK